MPVVIKVPGLGWLAKLADTLMAPVMYLVAGTFREKPQRGHRWNYIPLAHECVDNLEEPMMVHCHGISGSLKSRWLFLYHIPIIGGWRNYVVLQPRDCIRDWHVGFFANDKIGVSQVLLHGPVRMLIGPGDVKFFGIGVGDFCQIPIISVGIGKIGGGGKFSKIPLL